MTLKHMKKKNLGMELRCEDHMTQGTLTQGLFSMLFVHNR